LKEGCRVTEHITIGLHGAALRLQSNRRQLIDYARSHFSGSLVSSAPDIEVSLQWSNSSSKTPPGEWDRVDRVILARENEVFWEETTDLAGLALHFRLEPNLWIEGHFRHSALRSAAKSAAKRLVGRFELKGAVYHMMNYLLVYYPLFWHLETVRAMHPLHACAVDLGGRGIVLAGLSRVGKSSLALHMVGQRGARLLSDNLILHDGLNAYSVPEPIRLDQASQQMLGELRCLAKIPQDAFWERDVFVLSDDARAQEVPISGVFLTRFANKAEPRRLGFEEALAALGDLSLIAWELRRYGEYASVVNQAAGRDLVGIRRSALKKLVESVPCFELPIIKGDEPDRIVDEAILPNLKGNGTS
jgi:hypothetical protein